MIEQNIKVKDNNPNKPTLRKTHRAEQGRQYISQRS